MTRHHVSAGVILLAVAAPSLAGLLMADGPRAHYVGTALLVAAMLLAMWPGAATAERIALGLGIALHVAAAGCGVLIDSGACVDPRQPSLATLAVLGGIATVAALVSGGHG